MNRSQRRVPVARALLAALLVLALTACGSGGEADEPVAKPSVSAAPEDAAVEVIGLPEGTEASIRDTSAAADDTEFLDFVSPLHTLAPAGELEAPATVRVELDNALPTTATVLVATRDAEDEPFAFTRGYLTTDQQHVQFTTRKLNQVGVVSVDVPGALARVEEDLVGGLSAAVDTTVRRQACEEAAGARKDEYSATSSKQKTLFWCFRTQQGKRVVQLTNRRRVPVQVAHPDVAVVGNPRSVPAWSSWTGPLGLRNTLLSPGQTVTFDAELQPRSRLVLTATSTRPAQSLRLLRATALALTQRLAGFGLEPPTSTATFDAMLALPSCKRSLAKGGAALLTGCLGPAQVTRLFGTARPLVDPLVTDATFGSLLRSQAGSVAAQVRTEETQRVVVRRGAPKFDGFTGSWSGKNRALRISAAGLVTEAVYSGAQLVIQLTYQLDDPTTRRATASAAATLTKVQVGNRELLNGRVPQAGDEGTLRINAGVVTPPFLRTSYCNAAKQRACAG